jgi:hypothetical protein
MEVRPKHCSTEFSHSPGLADSLPPAATTLRLATITPDQRPARRPNARDGAVTPSRALPVCLRSQNDAGVDVTGEQHQFENKQQ